MSRGRPGMYVKQITGRDEKLLAELSRVGMASAEQARRFCGLNRDRLERLQNSKYIEIQNHTVRGQNIELLKLANDGRDYCRQNFGATQFPIAQLNHAEHDVKLAEMYFSLPSSVQETWSHEQLIVRDLYERDPGLRGHLETCIDATVTISRDMFEQLRESDNFRNFDSNIPIEENHYSDSASFGGDITIAIEAIGSSYTGALMDMKADIAADYGCSGMYAL